MQIPVLLLVYNRPEKTKRVLEQLKNCGISRVFVSADGQKDSDENKFAKQVQNVLKQYDSIIESVRISETNLGCKVGVTTGINWFFEHVDEGVILEDDCLPSEHFFSFISDMIPRYRDEKEVMMISGSNPLGEWQTEAGHFFTRFGHIWGWATWKDRWKGFDVELPEFARFMKKKGFQKAFGPTDFAAYMQAKTNSALKGKIDTWDYQWNAHILMQKGLAVVPSANLVENIGFGVDGTHDNCQPNWIENKVTKEPISISEQNIQPDCEYEMEWHLAKKSNESPNLSSTFFLNLGKGNKHKLRVLLVNSTDSGGGAEYISRLISNKLEELGHHTMLLVETKQTNFKYVDEIRDWEKQVATFNPDVIHIHNLHGTSISLEKLAKTSHKIPTLFTLHDSWLSTGSVEHPFRIEGHKLSLSELRHWKAILNKRKQLIGNSNIKFTTPSQWMRELFFQRHAKKAYYVPNTVENLTPESIDIPSNRYILYVANRPETNPYKDFKTLKEAWLKANKHLGSKAFDLVVVGGDSRIESHEENNIIFVKKSTPEVIRQFMKNALFVVVPSKQDNAPLTILEAHQCGKLVVASLIGGIPEMLSLEEAALQYEEENVESLSMSLINALDTAATNWNGLHQPLENMVNTYLGHYLELTNG